MLNTESNTSMGAHVCPWYVGYLLANPLRRLLQSPERILSTYVKKGMTVLEIGPGMGFFSLPMARLVAESGRVLCVDVQERMIRTLKKRAAKAGLSERIEARVCTSTSLQIDEFAAKIDFALAFAVVHEVPDVKKLLSEIYGLLRNDGVLMLSEPKGHVTQEDFQLTLSIARNLGFKILESPEIRRSHSAVLQKSRMEAG
ncbi:MAG: class I SAM-dependent methyltransferase [Bacteroidota bacterium]|jgi:2-polyprenyl-3-methyl-5-hydroxy-6-metoxy-1,4-benzoquinol methylase